MQIQCRPSPFIWESDASPPIIPPSRTEAQIVALAASLNARRSVATAPAHGWKSDTLVSWQDFVDPGLHVSTIIQYDYRLALNAMGTSACWPLRLIPNFPFSFSHYTGGFPWWSSNVGLNHTQWDSGGRPEFAFITAGTCTVDINYVLVHNSTFGNDEFLIFGSLDYTVTANEGHGATTRAMTIYTYTAPPADYFFQVFRTSDSAPIYVAERNPTAHLVINTIWTPPPPLLNHSGLGLCFSIKTNSNP